MSTSPQLGFRSIQEAIGHAELIDVDKAIDHWKASGLDLTPILHVPQSQWEQSPFQTIAQDHGLDRALDNTLITLARAALDTATPVTIDLPIRNVNRTTGTMLGSELTRKWGGAGLPDDTIQINFTGSAGQSFAAFVPKGITMRLVGDANDYFGKGLSGGRIVLRPPFDARFIAEDNIIAGNVILYGATSGECFIRGVVGERFCVRNSGATAVVEGVGDHGCEYMTGGRAVILGPTGRNFAAGMSGGVAFVHDPDRTFRIKVNYEMVDLDRPDEDDLDWLRECIHRHTQETGSAVGNRILARWDQERDLFVKVMPQDYKRVLAAQLQARETGQDEQEAIMAAAHG